MAPPRGERASPLPALLHEVRRARRRWVARRALASIAIVVASAAVVRTGVAGFVAAGWLDATPGVAWNVMAALIVVGAGVALVSALRRLPSEHAMARRVDDAFGLESRLVSAYELEADPPTHHVAVVMRDALLEELRSVVPRVAAEHVVPLHFRPVHAVALVAIATSVVAGSMADTWLSPRGASSGGVDDAAEAPLREARQRDLATELEALADALEEEADETRDAYTRALAEGARDLARDVKNADTRASAQDAEDDVQRLLSHIEEALGSRMAAASGQGRAQADGGRPDEQEATVGEDVDVPTANLALPAPEGGSSAALEEVRSARERLESAQSQRTGDFYASSMRAAESSADRKFQEAGIVGEAPDGAAGAPAGAAERSTDAPGDAAGAGTQDLEGESVPRSVSSSKGMRWPFPKPVLATGPV